MPCKYYTTNQYWYMLISFKMHLNFVSPVKILGQVNTFSHLFSQPATSLVNFSQHLCLMATILESLVGSCAKKLQDVISDEAILILGVKQELTELQRRMEQIRHFFNDAEQRSTKESAVNNWLTLLRDAMYDADDIIDLARSKGSKLLPDHSLSSSSKSNTCTGLSLSSCFSNIQTRHEVAV